MNPTHATHRILVVDDNPAIHEDMRKILASRRNDPLAEAEAALFGESLSTRRNSQSALTSFDVTSALQGQEALALVEEAILQGTPYEMAFVDVRMPPGWNGIETIQHLWRVDPDLEVVIFTAYSDHTWHDIVEELGCSDRFLYLKKPFETLEVRQMAISLSVKNRWRRAATVPL